MLDKVENPEDRFLKTRLIFSLELHMMITEIQLLNECVEPLNLMQLEIYMANRLFCQSKESEQSFQRSFIKQVG